MIGRKDPTAPAFWGAMVVVVVLTVGVIVRVKNCAHLEFLSILFKVLNYLRDANTSAGCTTCPVLLDQLFFVKVITAAISVSDSCFHAGMV